MAPHRSAALPAGGRCRDQLGVPRLDPPRSRTASQADPAAQTAALSTGPMTRSEHRRPHHPLPTHTRPAGQGRRSDQTRAQRALRPAPPHPGPSAIAPKALNAGYDPGLRAGSPGPSSPAVRQAGGRSVPARTPRRWSAGRSLRRRSGAPPARCHRGAPRPRCARRSRRPPTAPLSASSRPPRTSSGRHQRGQPVQRRDRPGGDDVTGQRTGAGRAGRRLLGPAAHHPHRAWPDRAAAPPPAGRWYAGRAARSASR